MINQKTLVNPSRLNAIRNPDGIWINTNVFREEALHYMKHGYYCGDRKGTAQYKEYWDEQLRRCKEGYTVGGATITGHHYGYMNFAKILKLDEESVKAGSKAAKKEEMFPNFWDGDYNYFHAKEIARWGMEPYKKVFGDLDNAALLEKLSLSVVPHKDHLNGGRHMLVGKSRRKGYSYKNGFVVANTYNTIRNSLCIIAAYDKAYLFTKGKGTMIMANNYLNFFNEFTAWGKHREKVDRIDAKKASFLDEVNGIEVEQGYMSEIIAITCKDNPDAVRGKDAYEAVLEELGAWPGFKEAFSALTPSMEAGEYITGQIVGFGTGGDMESGTLDFAEMFYNPDLYRLMPFVNIWDEDSEATECAFFHPMQWNREGFMDEIGNSDAVKAVEVEAKLRDAMRAKASSGAAALERRVQEHPTKPSEAFLTVSTNNFPTTELRNRYNKIEREKLDIKMGQPVWLYRDSAGKVRTKLDLTGELTPIWKRKAITADLKGAVIIYEYPVTDPPWGAYKIGYDPFAQNEGGSYGSIFVIKGNIKNSFTSDSIVAEYTGRPGDADEMNRQFELLCELYNSPGMHENMVIHVKSYFIRRHKLNLLAFQPDQIIKNTLNKSKVSRTYGIHMDEKLKDAGEKYIKTWLLRERGVDEQGNVITNIDLIYSRGLLEELIMYNRKGNFDRVMALMMCMFQMEEEELEYEYEQNKEIQSNSFVDLIPKLFTNQHSS